MQMLIKRSRSIALLWWFVVASSALATEVIVTGNDGTKEISISSAMSICVLSDRSPSTSEHEKAFASVVRSFSQRPPVGAGRTEFEVRSANGRLLARAVHENEGRPRTIEIVDTNRQVTVATITTNDEVMDLSWDAHTTSLLTLQRRFMRSSWAPLSLLAAIAGHPSAINQFRLVRFDSPQWKEAGTAVVAKGEYSLAIISPGSSHGEAKCR